MDEKTVKGYLVGYDGDEICSIFIKESVKVVTSRDVQFQKPCEEEQISLPFKGLYTDLEKDNPKIIRSYQKK